MAMKVNVVQLVHKIQAGEISPPSGTRAISRLRDEIRQRAVLKGGEVTDSSLRETLNDVLIQAMSEVLALERQEIDRDGNISEYGFDSITLAEFARKIVQRYPFMKLEPSTFLELPTLSGLASFLVEKYGTELLQSGGNRVGVGKLSPEQLEIEIEPEEAGISRAPQSARSHKLEPESRDSAIAIIGIAGRFPGAENVGELWKNLIEEKVMLSKVPADRWNWREISGDPQKEDGKTDCCYGAFLQDVSGFDALHFGISPAEAELLDPQHRILLEVAWEAIENAGYRKSALHNRPVGVFIGVEKQDYKELINKSRFELNPYTNTGNTHSMLVNRLSYFFNWRGPSVAVDTACSSSLAAIEQACASLRSGRAEMALAGGINLLLTPWIFVVNRKLGMLTNEPVMRPFDRNASGHLNGEGAALVVLKKLSDAIADNDIIYGVIRGISVQHGGRGTFLNAPNPAGHRAVIEDALSEAGLQPSDIDYIEAQGTADQITDRVELKTYQAIFGRNRAEPVKIGTAKGNFGHLGAASGVTALIKTVLCFRNQKLPSVLNLQNLNWTEDDGELQCELVTHTQDWPARQDGSTLLPRRAGIHNFGYGGVNAHAIVEEYPTSSMPEPEAAENSIIVLSARTKEQLRRYANNLLSFLRERNYQHYGIRELPLRALAYTLQVGRESMEYRMAMVVNNLLELEQGLASFCRGESGTDLLFSGKAHKRSSGSGQITQAATHEAALGGALSLAESVELARSWVAGKEINWPEVYRQAKPQKVPLPTYPFTRERYWIPQESDSSTVHINRDQRSITSMQSKESAEGHNDAALEILVSGDLKRQICSLLKLRLNQLDEEIEFVHLGFSSQTLTQFAGNLSGLFGIDVKPEVFFSYPSIRQLSEYFVNRYRAAFEAFYKQKPEYDAGARQTRELAVDEEVKKVGLPMRRKNRKSEIVPGDEPIAVIGMSGRFPGAESTSELWDILAAGKSMISEVPKERWDWREYYHGRGNAANEITTNRGGFISGIAEFDPIFFNLSPREAELIDPRQRLLLQEAWRAFEDAGYAGGSLRGTACGVFIGVEEGEYEKLTGDEGLMTGTHNGILASRISYFLDLKGPSLAINTACSSGLAAVHLACQSLQRGETEMALAGAVHLLLSPGTYKQLTRLGMLSESGQCFTFDERGDGIVPGEAAAVLVLKRLSSAIEDKDNIYGVIKGCGLNYKGRTNGITAPSGLSQQQLIEQIYERCGIRAGDVDYVAAHGTGTKLGDSVEVSALTEAFRGSGSQTGYCALGSIKANLGHTFAVSGIASMIAVLLAMKHNTIPGSVNCGNSSEFLLASGSPFYINSTASHWAPQSGRKRLAAVSAFGISGTNAHVVLEEYISQNGSELNAEEEGLKTVIVPLSARNEERLREYAERLLAHVKNGAHRGVNKLLLRDLAYTLQTGREPMDCRIAFVVKDMSELASCLQNFLEGSADEKCFRGRVERDLGILQMIGSDQDMQETIRRWISKGRLQNVAALWVIGADIDWEQFKCGDEVRTSLPTYPFARRSCWFHSRRQVTYGSETAAPETTEAPIRSFEGPTLTFRRNLGPVLRTPRPATRDHEAVLQPSEKRIFDDGIASEESWRLLDSMPDQSGDKTASAVPHLQLQVDIPQEQAAKEQQTAHKSTGHTPELNLHTIEQDLQMLVGEVLYLDKGEVETRKKFIDMGMDSVIGMELVNKLNQRYSLKISATRLYDYPNIVELAKYVHDTLIHRGDGGKSPLRDAHAPDDKSVPATREPIRTTDSLTDQLRDVLKRVTADALTVDDAEQLIATTLGSLSQTA